MFERRGVLVHPNELDEMWLNEMKRLNLNPGRKRFLLQRNPHLNLLMPKQIRLKISGRRAWSSSLH